MDLRKNNGGKREGAGRPTKKDKEKKKSYNVYLKEKQKNYLDKKHQSLTAAITTLLPDSMK